MGERLNEFGSSFFEVWGDVIYKITSLPREIDWDFIGYLVGILSVIAALFATGLLFGLFIRILF